MGSLLVIGTAPVEPAEFGSGMADYTILLIDYDPRSVESIKTSLKGEGYRVAVAHDGEAAMEAFAAIQPDLTLVEAMLPKKHGFEVCRELKETEHGANHPIVIITAIYKGRKYRQEGFHKHKCDEYMEKPFDKKTLLEAVQRLLPDETETPAHLNIDRSEPPPPAVKPAAPVADHVPDKSRPGLLDHLSLAPEADDEINDCLNAIMPD